MRRGPKPAKAKGEAKPPVTRKSPKNNDAMVRDLEKRLAEALEQQTATSEILRVISQSPTDVQPVFDTIARNAVGLCEADRALVYRFGGQLLRLAVAHNASAELRAFIEGYPFGP